MTDEITPEKKRTPARTKTETASLDDLSAKYAKALETIEMLSQTQARLTQQIGAQRPMVPMGQLVVGVRNVSNYTVGLVDRTSGTPIEYSLNPEVPGVADPNVCAVVSYAYWQQLRKSNYVGRGLIQRDDTVLGPADNAAPEDRPQDMHPEAEQNTVLNPREWILGLSEDELRSRIFAITSEPTLRRLQHAVDQEILRIGAERYLGSPERATKAIRDLPGRFRIVEELAAERLDELNPISAVRHLELDDTIRARRR